MQPRITPALVAQRAAVRLPRWALVLLCALYLLPGLIGRDPWRNEELQAFGVMAAIAEGRTDWWAPTLGEVPVHPAWATHLWGAGFVAALDPLGISGPVAARIAFALVLGATLALIWWTIHALARTDAAQPVAFAFGGEADPRDYARALADSGLLATVSTLGLLQLGHETTSTPVQLFASALLLWGLSRARLHRLGGSVAMLVAPVLLATNEAPLAAVALPVLLGAGLLLSHRDALATRLSLGWPLAGGTAAAVLVVVVGPSAPIDLTLPDTEADLGSLLRLYAWFLWPAWPLALWTLWRWRRQLREAHIALPAAAALAGLMTTILMDGDDRTLLLALPGVAILAAFALPTLQRGTSAAIEWFSVCFFSVCAIAIWVIHLSLQTGWPTQPRANVLKLAPGFEPIQFWPAVLLAALGTVAWFALVRWRTGRHQHPMWKALVLPASGVILCWLLLMSLWLPMLDYARSLRPWVQRIQPHAVGGRCLAAPGLAPSYVAALEVHGGWRVDAREGAATGPACGTLLLMERRGGPRQPQPPGWTQVATIRRPTERQESTRLFVRQAP